jgi:hypothetical protein
LIQATLGGIEIDDWSLQTEAESIFNSGLRLCRALMDVLRFRQCFAAFREAAVLSAQT